jgi:hypothetical protein
VDNHMKVHQLEMRLSTIYQRVQYYGSV